jgi:hypothetical protein
MMVIGNLRSFWLYIVNIYMKSLGNMGEIGAGKRVKSHQLEGSPSTVLFSGTGFIPLCFPKPGDLDSDAVAELLVEAFAVAEEEQDLSGKA